LKVSIEGFDIAVFTQPAILNSSSFSRPLRSRFAR
jgi:hypothetical protein